MKNSQHMSFWLILAVLGFLLSPLIRSGDSMQQYLQQEIAQTQSAMGERAGTLVIEFADSLFNNSPLSAGANVARSLQQNKHQMQLSAKVAGIGGAYMSSVFNSYMQGLMMQTYVVAMRLAIVLFWLVFVAPMLVASIYDGLMMRSVKFAEFGSMRPATFTLAGMLVIPALVTPVLYLVLPFHISPNLAPVWAAAVVLPLSVLVSNSQPLFGR